MRGLVLHQRADARLHPGDFERGNITHQRRVGGMRQLAHAFFEVGEC